MSGAGSYNIYKSELSDNGPMSKAAALTISPNVLVTLPVNTPIKAADCPARQLSVSLLELTANLREVSIIREKAPTY